MTLLVRTPKQIVSRRLLLLQLGTTLNNGLAGWETLLADPIGTLNVPPRALFKQ